MKQKRIYKLWAVVAPVLCAGMVACQKDNSCNIQGKDGAQALAITVTDGGYGDNTADNAQPTTRTKENAYRTEFTAGDECGLYVVRGGKLIYDNIRLTATDEGGGFLTWQPAAGTTLVGGLNGESYFLYYPYQENMSGKVDTGASDDAAFFATLISGWQTKADQSNYDDYTASDLMTATGTIEAGFGNKWLVFSMTHRMAMAVIDVQNTVYKFNDYPDIVYSTTQNVDFTGQAKPYSAEGLYRYLVRPANGAEVTATYDNGMEHDFKVSIAENSLTAGCYKAYKVDGGTTVAEYDTYAESGVARIGDFYCTKDNGTSGYLIPKEADKATVQAATVVGIVFQTASKRIGAAEKAALAAKGIGEPHGLVMAVKNAAREQKWNLDDYMGEGLKQCISKADNYNDISGYGNCTHIRNNRGSFDNYPAFKSADDYNTLCPVPATTTGWYLPASGQWWDILQHLGGCPALADPKEQSSTEYTEYKEHFYWKKQGDVIATLNGWMAYIADENKEVFTYNFSEEYGFSTSSELDPLRANTWYVLYGTLNSVCKSWSYKSGGQPLVRTILAF